MIIYLSNALTVQDEDLLYVGIIFAIFIVLSLINHIYESLRTYSLFIDF